MHHPLSRELIVSFKELNSFVAISLISVSAFLSLNFTQIQNFFYQVFFLFANSVIIFISDSSFDKPASSDGFRLEELTICSKSLSLLIILEILFLNSDLLQIVLIF